MIDYFCTMKVLIIFGTRPEAIKLLPIIKKSEDFNLEAKICVTGQHREMLDQVLKLFDVTPDYDLNIMKPRQTLGDITSSILSSLDEVLRKENPDIIIVQGDTTSAFAAGLAAFYHKIKVAHVEAGLRTENKYNPFPEEINRRLLSVVADYHFAPTQKAADNLNALGIIDNVLITGNTVIDALLWVSEKKIPFENKKLLEVDFAKDKIILLTMHRRENLEDGVEDIFQAITEITDGNPGVKIILPVHLNPVIQKLVKEKLAGNKKVLLLPPLNYSDLVNVLKKCYLVMTDSGGIQEEAPFFGKPVVILRKTTERPEGIEAGVATLAGVKINKIVRKVNRLLNNTDDYNSMAKSANPYGDGHSSEKILNYLFR